jgi:hypothetical protein
MKSILQKAGPADVIREPFPHVVIDDALDADLYARLMETFPPAEVIVGDQLVENNTPYRMRAARLLEDERVAECWKEFVREHTSGEFFREVLGVFGGAIRELHPGLPALEQACTRVRDLGEGDVGRIGRIGQIGRIGGEGPGGPIRPIGPIGPIRPIRPIRPSPIRPIDIALDCQPCWGSPVTRASSSDPCHVDRPVALFAGLLYCRLPGDDTPGGDLELYRFRGAARRYDATRHVDPSLVEPVKRIPYAANRLVFFLQSPHSLHGVTERAVTSWPRLHVNFLAELPTNIFELESSAASEVA